MEKESKTQLEELSPAQVQALVLRLERYKHQADEMTQASHQLIITQSRLEALLHRATVGIITFAPDGAVQTFNKAVQQIFGYTEGEVIGCNIPHLIPVNDHSHNNVVDYLREFIATRATDDTPVVGLHKSGDHLLLQISTGESGNTDVEILMIQMKPSPLMMVCSLMTILMKPPLQPPILQTILWSAFCGMLRMTKSLNSNLGYDLKS